LIVEASSRLGDQFEVVLEAARAGADWAWARIYDDFAPTILGYLRSRGAPDPEGVSGDVFCQLVRDINRFEGDEAGFRSWVFVMVHHRLLDDLRKRKRRPETSVGSESFWDLEGDTDVEGEAAGRASEVEIRAILDELSEAQRDVLLMRIFGDLKIDEIATAMGRRPGAVKALQRRGLQVVREKLAERGMYPEAAPYPSDGP
jgi:RNA polymerase sigma factor (sigma-70 family)